MIIKRYYITYYSELYRKDITGSIIVHNVGLTIVLNFITKHKCGHNEHDDTVLLILRVLVKITSLNSCYNVYHSPSSRYSFTLKQLNVSQSNITASISGTSTMVVVRL